LLVSIIFEYNLDLSLMQHSTFLQKHFAFPYQMR
jgi:hypothetical protein